ncbi:peptidoglycan-binding domain-containing protein [Terrabacter sp. 2RAF25]|uniref:peptidoglycan-binding domain-containing protein n=1 Tax=Terrabacter sp. 2RAF25 TaxID=3232998 RepID=UPI003F9C9DBE
MTQVASGRGRRRVPASLAAAVALGLGLTACSTAAPTTPTAAESSAPAVSETTSDPPTGTAAPGPTAPLPTVTADPLTPTKPTPSATTTKPTPTATATDPGTVAGACERTQPAYPVVSPGSKGPAVSALQCFLNDADFGPVAVDGVYGAQTREALRRVEATFEGPAPKPGRVDAGVWVLIISRSMGSETLKQGAKGPEVETLQRALRAAGGTITVDGTFGPETKKVVQRFQDANRIGEDGVVGDETLFLLKSGATIG